MKETKQSINKDIDKIKDKIKDRLKDKDREEKSGIAPLTSNRLELLFVVVNRQKASFYSDLLLSFGINMEFKVFGEGTVTSEMRDIMGFSSNSEKTLIVGIIREDMVQTALETLEAKFRTIRNGKGIAWTVSMTSVIGVSVYSFLSDNRKAIKEVMNNG